MKKILLVISVVLILAIASISTMAAAPAGKGHADGLWCYMPTGILPVTLPGDEYVGDPNKQFFSAAYDSVWTGLIAGTSKDYGLAVAHDGVPILFTGTASFKDVQIAGRVGDLEMDAIGDRPGPTADWQGKWVITSGTDDFENLQAQGTFWGPGWLPPDGGSDLCPEGFGVIYYAVDGPYRRHFK